MTANPTPPTVGRPLTETERTMLRYALDQAQDQMLCVGDEFSEDDHTAIDSLRRLADEVQQPEPSVHGESVAHLAGLHGRRGQWADEAQEQEPEAETGTLYPARHTWTFEVCYDPDRDKWHGCGPTYDDSVFDNAHETAQEDFQHRAENDKQRRRFRMIRATTAYTVEAEHQPAVDARQDGTQS